MLSMERIEILSNLQLMRIEVCEYNHIRRENFIFSSAKEINRWGQECLPEI